MQKKCPLCKEIKNSSEFYKSPKRYDGLRAYCKECTKFKQRLNRKYYKDYQKKRRFNDEKFRKKTYKWNNKSISRKIGLSSIVQRALKNNKLKKDVCKICGEKNVQAHHEDYSKPLEVIWLCPKHHKQLHSGTIDL